MKVKKIICLNCDTTLESDYDKKEYKVFVKCGCPNETSLENYFTMSQPGSVVKAIDKTKVKAQALEDYPFAKKDEWFYLIKPKTKETPKGTGG